MLRKGEELFEIQGDAASGIVMDYNLDHGKIEVPIRWRDRMMFVDVYEMGDHLMIHLLCPKCLQGLRVLSQKKRIRFLRAERRLSIERIGCSRPECDWSAVTRDNIAI